MRENNKLFYQYVRGATDDAGIESLRLYLPIEDGYVNYNIVHSVSEGRQCDTWRLGVVYLCDEKLCRIRPLTRAGAEWEMALKLTGRPDFIGGYAHGDEVFDKIEITVDGLNRKLDSLSNLSECESLDFEVWSRGYDPSAPQTQVLEHYKMLSVNAEGVRVEQKVDWLSDFELGNCYMAMMPPYKAETDVYYTDKDTTPKPICEPVSISGNSNALYLSGKSGLTFCMKVEKHLSCGEAEYYISDNGGVPYNKMYFVLPHGKKTTYGDIWQTCTVYSINK
ncbi:MAG: hypothetical protein E7649_00090 [Ruminococcaceae bacterium]|nr:hypothetical protein [Oscillospiraceae bacterium]